ncbi:MAG: hypothetical protein J3K34DRAFT_403857 [Monoraphidium minutum]|nr:MAG: hypothetical protein J3K34DRAFT_403857 [Monoraphidium minutum]
MRQIAAITTQLAACARQMPCVDGAAAEEVFWAAAGGCTCRCRPPQRQASAGARERQAPAPTRREEAGGALLLFRWQPSRATASESAGRSAEIARRAGSAGGRRPTVRSDLEGKPGTQREKGQNSIDGQSKIHAGAALFDGFCAVVFQPARRQRGCVRVTSNKYTATEHHAVLWLRGA